MVFMLIEVETCYVGIEHFDGFRDNKHLKCINKIITNTVVAETHVKFLR